MRLERELSFVARTDIAAPERLGAFREHLDPAWIDAALAATGKASVRKRRLPAEQVVWTVVGMGLMRSRPIKEVVDTLDLALEDRKPVVASAVSQARDRLGSEPMKWLFERTGATWGHRSAGLHRWHGLSIYALDGTTLAVPDSTENRATFGGAKAGAGRGESGYPLVRGVALMAARSHLLVAARFGGYAVASEIALARGLFNEVPDRSLTLIDRNFLIASVLVGLSRGGEDRHWMTRAKSNTRMTVIETLGRNDTLVELPVSPAARRADPGLPTSFRARAVTYSRKGFPPSTVLTSLTDRERFPAAEIVAMYHERWEIELAYDEIKTEMLGAGPTLRSQKPDGVLQELYGVVLAYNLVRLEMERVALREGLAPTRLSFVISYRMIVDTWLLLAGTGSPGAMPKHLERLSSDIARFTLPARRAERNYPRAVKVKMSNYARKRPKHVAEDAK